jgi:aryl-alcohol dehydrogenase-like predicted oxidoreductase
MHALCREYDIGLLASFALQGGILTGKYQLEDAAESVRYDSKRLEELRSNGTLDRVARFVALAGEMGYSPAQLAYAYCLRHPLVASVLFGATSTAQVEENLSALEVAQKLDEESVARLAAIFPLDSGFGN